MKSASLDCLFVHVPKAHNHYLPFGDFMNICYMPMGLPAVAEFLRRNGWSTEIVHLGVERILDPSFSVARAFDGASIRAIGLPLYWHYQAFDVIEVSRALRAAQPDAFIFLGGVTAAYFAEEILREYPHIDAVICGHGELPALELMPALRDATDLGNVPNLVWRTPDRSIRDNRTTHRYVARTPDLDELVFGDLSVLRHAETYAGTFGFPFAYGWEYSQVENRKRLNMGRPFFPLFTGRGCPWSCTFCGGNRDTLRRVNGTSGLTWRSPTRVVDDIRLAMSFGYRTMSLCFDPTPTKDEYYVTLFELIRKAKLEVDFYFECWGLPTKRFVQAFKETFPSPESYLAISPDAGDERVRRANKQPYFSDEEMFATVETLRDHELSADVFYTIALPGERLQEGRKTRDQMHELAARFPNLRRIIVWTVQLEPGSPQFERPEQFEMVTDRNCFVDFYKAHGGQHADTYSSLGFKINNYFGDERDHGGIAEFERAIQHFKCMELCFLAPDPRDFALPEQGRKHCFERRKALAARRGTPPPQLAIGDGADYTDALSEEMKLRGQVQRRSWT
jgi:radical SAM superfamily enzyme YgiQ (UPF0313 family)